MAWTVQQAKQQHKQVIQAGQINNTNPWLQITRWAKYLQGVDLGDLLAVLTMADPNLDLLTTVEINTELVVMVLQETMAQLVYKSQQTIQHYGHAIHIKAIHTKASQTPHQPLIAYLNLD